MNCLDGLIADDNSCTSTTGVLRLRDIGISETFIGKLLGADDKSTTTFMEDRRRIASEYVVRDVLRHYNKSIIPRTFVDRDRVGRWTEPTKLDTGSNLYRHGMVIEVCAPASNLRIDISRIEFFGNTTGDVDVDVHDMLSGELLVTETISATAGQVSGKEVNISIQARRQKMRLFVSTQEDEFYRGSVTDGCSTCFGKVVYKNGILQANTGRILKADAVQYQNLTSYSYTGGLSAIVSVSCDHGAWICEMKSAMALPLIYCLGREVLTGALYNFDRWGIKDLRKEDVKERRDELEALYSKSMSDLYEWMPIPQDPSCFVCNSRTSTGVILP